MAAPMWSIYRSAVMLLVFARSCNSDGGLLPTNYEIDTVCDDVLEMEYENITSGTLKSSETSTDEFHSDCWVTIIAPPEHYIVIHVIEVDTEHETNGVCRGYVIIWDGSENRTGLTIHLCDTSNITMKSSGRDISVHVHRENTTREKEINILFTSFHAGICEPGEFKCDNGYCIDGRLKCNGFNNCGDESDMCDSIWPVILSLCGIALLIGFIVFIVRLVIRRHHRVQFHKGGYVIKETTPMTAPPPQHYVQPTAPNMPWADQSPEGIPTQNPTHFPVQHLPGEPPLKYEFSPSMPYPMPVKN